MDNYGEVFREEAYERLAELESSLIALEEAPDDAEMIGCAFRAMHTIKGSGAMFGFDDVVALTHEAETVFDLVRSGAIKVTKELVDLTFSACDQIKEMLQSGSGDKPDNERRVSEIISLFRSLLHDSIPHFEKPGQAATSLLSPALHVPLNSTKSLTYRIRFRPLRDVFAKGINPVFLLDELCRLGECNVIAHTDGIPSLDGIESGDCYVFWDILLTLPEGGPGIEAIRDVFIFIEDECDLKIELIDEGDISESQNTYKKLGEILVERGDIEPEELGRALAAQKRLGEVLVETGLVDSVRVQSALAEQEHVKGMRERRQREDLASSIKVPSDKLDNLMNLVGELVTFQARFNQVATYRKDRELRSMAQEIERLGTELRDSTMAMRMVAIGTTFGKFKRLVRDLSNELGKEVELTTEGAETELDKTIIERLSDPLVHLIRNSMDHGIEPPQTREAAGKPRHGVIHLAAEHSGAHVLVRISDDGAGLDPEAIRAKAVEKGLIAPDAEMSERNIYGLIFLPGFSTAREVTNVSGRGVGMDVVKRTMDALRGSIEISGQKGVGTTIVLRLPLTLAIITGLLVRIGMGHFVLPLSTVEGCVELTRADVAKNHGERVVLIRGQIVPYIHLREIFNINGAEPPIEQIVIAEIEGSMIGFVVDRVIGEHQTVIKSLGRMYKDVHSISGATVLGDGTVALILDVARVLKDAEGVGSD